MTNEELRAIDNEVALKVLGWVKDPFTEGGSMSYRWKDLGGVYHAFIPNFSAEIRELSNIYSHFDDWKIVKTREFVTNSPSSILRWCATFELGSVVVQEWAETESLAVCKAALKAMI